MKRVMQYTAVILATLAALVVLWQFKLVLLLFVLSLFAAAAIRPLVDAMVTRGLPKGAAQLLLYVVGLGGLVLLLVLAGDLLLLELNLAINRTVVDYESLYRSWQDTAGWQQTAVTMMPPPFNFATAQETELGEMMPAVMQVARGITGALGGLLLLLALSVYWSVDQHRFERLWLSLLPAKRRAYIRNSWRDVETAVGNYLRSQTVQSLLAFLFISVGSAVLGFDYPLLLGFVGALAAFIPLFGDLLTAVLALALGFVGGGSAGATTAVLTLLIFIGLELIVEPRLWPRKRRSFLLTLLVILPLFEAFGLWGLIVAPPLAAALEAAAGQAYQGYLAQRQTAVQLEALEIRYQQLVQKISQTENEPVTPELENLTQRLATLLTDSRQMNLD